MGKFDELLEHGADVLLNGRLVHAFEKIGEAREGMGLDPGNWVVEELPHAFDHFFVVMVLESKLY